MPPARMPASLPRGQLQRFPLLLQLFRVCKAANPRPCVIPSQSMGLAFSSKLRGLAPPLHT